MGAKERRMSKSRIRWDACSGPKTEDRRKRRKQLARPGAELAKISDIRPQASRGINVHSPGRFSYGSSRCGGCTAKLSIESDLPVYLTCP